MTQRERDSIMLTMQDAVDRKNRAFRTAMQRGRRLARAADPATDGNETLVHNWGNAEARRAWRETWRRWNAYDAAYERIIGHLFDLMRQPAA